MVSLPYAPTFSAALRADPEAGNPCGFAPRVRAEGTRSGDGMRRGAIGGTVSLPYAPTFSAALRTGS